MNIGDTMAIGIQKFNAATEIEKLFYKCKFVHFGFARLPILEHDSVIFKRILLIDQGRVVRKPINADLRLKVNRGFYFALKKWFKSLISS